MSSAHIGSLVAVSVVGFLMSACASIPKTIYTQEEIVAQMDTRVSAEMRDQIVIPFEIDEEIGQLADDITRGMTSDKQKVGAIVNAIIGLTEFSISYDFLSNKTAKEVFRQGRGNCLAYSNLFVGMARHVGLEGVYVDVTSIERQTKEAEVIVNNGHVTAGIKLGPDVMVIDFTRTPEREYIGFKVIDDLEAIANYYNNQGFLYGYFTEVKGTELDFDPLEKEMEMYRLALEVLPTFQRARNNLGVGLRRRVRFRRPSSNTTWRSRSIQVSRTLTQTWESPTSPWDASRSPSRNFELPRTNPGRMATSIITWEWCSTSSSSTKKPSRHSRELSPKSPGWRRRGTISARAT